MWSCLIFLVSPSVIISTCMGYSADGTTKLIVTCDVSIKYDIYYYIGLSIYLPKDLK